MNNIYKRLIAVMVASIILVSTAVISIQAASDLLESATGDASLLNLQGEDFCEFCTTQADVAVTKEAHNVLNESIIIKNADIPNDGWGYIGFSAEKTSELFFNDISVGKLALFIEPQNSDSYILRMNEDTVIGSFLKNELYTFSFIKVEDKYNLVINGENYANSEIDDFIKNFGSSLYVSLQGNTYFKGSIKIDRLGWEYPQEPVNAPKLYFDLTDSIYAKMQENTVINTIEKVDWKTEALEIEDAVLTEGKQYSVVFNKVNKNGGMINSTDNGDIVNVILSKQSDNTVSVGIYDGTLKNLGNLPESLMYKFRYALKGSAYGLYINDVLFTDTHFNLFMTSALTDSVEAAKSFVVISTENAMDFKVNIFNPEWQHNSDDQGAQIGFTEDGFASISLTSKAQAVVSPKKYNLLNNEITIKNIGSIKSGKSAFIDFVKVLNKKGPSNATNEIITLSIERYGKKYELYAINSNNEKDYLTEINNTEETIIKIVNINDSLYFSINGKICKNANETVHSYLQSFIGSEEICMSYIGFSCSDKAKADIKISRYTPDVVELSGFKVYSAKGNYDAEGNGVDGYSVKGSGETYVISAPCYNASEKSLSAKVNTVGGYIWFSLSQTNKLGNALESGKVDLINKVTFLITPKTNNTQAQISYWNASGKAEETVVETIDFDWQAKHTYDVRKGSDNLWYLAIDGKLISKIDSEILTAFMEKNANTNLHFGIGGYSNFDADEIIIVEQVAGDNTVVQTTDWKFFTPNSSGLLEGDNDKGYAISNSSNYLYAFTEGKWDVTKKSVSINLDNVKKLRFYVSTTDALDTVVTPSGPAADINRVNIRIQPVQKRTKAEIHCENSIGKGGASPLTIIDFDWEGTHTFDIRQGSDGVWYFCVDNILAYGYGKTGIVNDFMNANSKRLRFGIGGFDGAFEANSLKVVDQEAIDTTVYDDYWGYYSGIGCGSSLGNNKDGYSIIIPTAAAFSTTRKKYDVEKTAVSFKVEELNAWICFGVSSAYYNDNRDLQKGQAEDVTKMQFLITPKLNTTHAQFSYWNASGTGGETVINTIEFDWYGMEHTYDIRKDEEEGHWYLCVDGRVLMNKHSDVLDDFMRIHEGENLYYSIGGIDAFGVSKLKIIDKSEVRDFGGDSGGFFDEDENGEFNGDFEFDFSNDGNYFDEENLIEYDDYNFFDEDIFSFGDALETVKEKDPHEGMMLVKVKKRRLIKGHGIIFNTFEKVSMILGAVVLVAGIVFSIIVIVKKRKKAKV